MNRRMLPLLMLATLLSCTTVRYTSPEFVPRAQEHRLVAVLPFVMVFGGNIPARLTTEQIEMIEERESLAFQMAFYDALLDRSGIERGNRITIALQPVEITNRLLATHGVSIRESWDMSSEELARMLGVDAVVRTFVEKTRYLSDLASFGVDLGYHVLHEVSHGRWGGLIPGGLDRTYDIFADASVLDGYDGTLLWKVAVHRATNWTRPANDVVVGVTRKLARQFPYRG